MIPELETLHQLVKEYLEHESSGHDIYHADRVYHTASYIQQKEGGDPLTIGASALVHDICRPWEKKTGKSHFGPEALEKIKSVLQDSKIPKELIAPILEVVALHDIYDWTDKMKDKSIELQIVQDADNLDAIGAIGIARTFAFSAVHGTPMYLPDEKLDFDRDFVDGKAVGRSTIAHFYEKLLKLKDHMNTKTGRELAGHRHQIMEGFLDQFFKEWQSDFT